MAPENSLRHVEILKIGKTKRLLQPPGGYSNGIFNSKEVLELPPRKMKPFYSKSDIFSLSEENTIRSCCLRGPAWIDERKTTKFRLFGPPEQTQTRKTVASQQWMKSSIFEPDECMNNGARKVRCQSARNPVTGENCSSMDFKTCQLPSRKIQNPITGEGISPKSVPASGRRNPPGGRSTLVLEYKE